MAPTRTPLLAHLGARVASLRADDLDDRGRGVFRTALADTLGVALAGATTAPARITRSALPHPPGPALVLGTAHRTDALDAGLLNGVAGHALDFDDGNSLMGGHPSTVLVPAVLAFGDELDASPTEAIAAYAAGMEVIVRISRAVNTAHYEKGWHPTATIGVLGVAAAAARLLGLDAERCTVALAVAASMASGVKASFGTMVKPLHVGHAVRDGLLAARLARGGFSANPRVLEARQGFLEVYNGPGRYDAEAMTTTDVAQTGPEINRCVNPIKAFPCCASTHSCVTSALAIRRQHDVSRADAGRVARITITVDRNRIPHIDRTLLPEALSGKFSVQYVVARALLDGRVSLEHFEGTAHRDPAVLRLMTTTTVVPAPPGGAPNSFAGEVTVTTPSGEQWFARTERSLPVAGPDGYPAGLWEKFADCAGRAAGTDRAAELAATVRAFTDFPGLRAFTEALEIADREHAGGLLPNG